MGPERTIAVAQREDLPGRLLAVESHRTERIGGGEAPHGRDAHTGCVEEVAQAVEDAMSSDGLDDACGFFGGKPAHEPKAESDRRLRGDEESVGLPLFILLWDARAGLRERGRLQRLGGPVGKGARGVDAATTPVGAADARMVRAVGGWRTGRAPGVDQRPGIGAAIERVRRQGRTEWPPATP